MFKSVMKWFLIVVTGLVLVATLAANLLFDERGLREQIRQQVEMHSGLHLQMDEPLSLSLFPAVALEGREIILSRTKGQHPPLTTIEQISIEVALMPLLQQRIEVDALEAVVDGVLWSGTAQWQQQKKGHWIRFNLQGEQLDLDRYMPKGEQPQAIDPLAGSAVGVLQLPLPLLRVLDLEGQLSIGRLQIAKAVASDVQLQVTAKGGEVVIGPLTANLYGGTYRGTVKSDLRFKQPITELEESFQKIDLERLLLDLEGVQQLRGTLSASGKGRVTGATQSSILNSLNGEAVVEVNHGAIIGINLQRLVRQAVALIRRQPISYDQAPNETSFEDLKATVRAVGGQLQIPDLKIKSGWIELSGAGWMEFQSQEIDYQLTAKVAENLSETERAGIEQLEGRSFPVRIQGTFTDPRVKVDLDGVLKETLQKKLQQKLDEKVKQLLGDPKTDSGQRIKKEFGNLLQRLF